jgi:hypothetical protein
LKEIFHCSFNFVVFYILHFFADQMLDFVCGFFLYASFVIYISISMVMDIYYRAKERNPKTVTKHIC